MTATQQPEQPNTDPYAQRPYYGQPQPPYPGFPGPPLNGPKPVKRRRWPWAVGGFFVFCILVSSMNDNDANGSGPSSNTASVNTFTPAASPTYPAPTFSAPASTNSGDTASVLTPSGSHVVYEIVGPKRAGTVTYSTGQGSSIGQQQTARLPWRKEFDVDGGFFVPVLSAQNSGSGSITCRITVDGQVVSEVTSEGQYAIASCAGQAIS